MDAPEPESSDNQILGLHSAPEIFAEGYRGAMFRAGVVKINFFANRFDPATERIEKHAVLTLAVPTADFPDIVRGFAALAQELQIKEAAEKAE